MLGFMDVVVAFSEVARENVCQGASEGVSKDDSKKRGEGEVADGFGIEEVW